MSTLAELSGRRDGDIAVECGDRQLTWAELDDRSCRVANGLETLGFSPGDHVAICVGNRIEFVEVLLGAWRAGAAYTPLKTGWTGSEVGLVLDSAQTRVVVADRDGARQAAGERGIPVIDLDSSYDDWLAAQSDAPPPADRCGYKLPFTSGTTGQPKGVVMSGSGVTPFASGWQGIAAYSEALHLPGAGVHLFVSRLFNGAPQTFGFGAMARGATLRILPQWDAATGLRELSRPDVTSSIMVPTMFRQLLALEDIDRATPPAPRLHTILHGGEPCPIPVKRAMADWFGDVLVEYYGFTEGGMTVVDATQWRERPGTVGKPLTGMTVRVLDEAGQDVETGRDGTVYFQMNSGRRFHYQGDEAKTEGSHLGDAFTVGDIGHVDDDGYLYLTGRSADVIISAGVNIYPAEIEQALSDVPGVEDLCAVGVPDNIKGEAVALFISLRPAAETATVLSALTTTSQERLAPYKRPGRIEVVTEIPRDQTGKLLRRLVGAQVMGGTAPPFS